MNRPRLAAGLSLALLLVSCASTSLDGVWVDPEYASEGMNNFLVLGIADNEANRRNYETEVANRLTKRGVRAVPGYTLIEDAGKVDETALMPIVEEHDIGAILVTRVLSVDTSTDYVPGSTYVVPDSYYHGFYGYYSRSYAVVSEPGYYTENTTVLLETNVYDASNAKLVWSGISRTYNPSNAESVIGEISSLIVERLNKDGLLAPTG